MPSLTCVERDAAFVEWLRGHHWPQAIEIRQGSPADSQGDLVIWNISQFPRPLETLLQGRGALGKLLVWDGQPPVEAQLQALRLGAVEALRHSERVELLVAIRRFFHQAESARTSEEMLQALLDRSYSQSVLNEVLQGLASSQDLETLYQQAVHPLWEIAGADWGQLWLPEQDLLVGAGPAQPSEAAQRLRLLSEASREEAGAHYVAHFPLVAGRPLGGMLLGGDTAHLGRLEAATPLLKAACGSIALAVANIQHLEDARRQAVLDGLTGLFNHAHFQACLRAEIDRASRYGVFFSLVLLDLDHFKAINDTHGHQTGDRALVATSALLRRMLRNSDLGARYGGEEFVLLLPSTGAEGAIALAERLRVALGELAVAGPAGADIGPLTGSFGVATYRPGDTAETVLRRADEALYVAKRTGRNRVCPEDGQQAVEALRAACRDAGRIS